MLATNQTAERRMMPRKKRPLPPPNRVPRDVTGMSVIDVPEYGVFSWSPDPRGCAPSTQVHLHLQTRGNPPLVLRFKSAAAVDEMIDALRRHRIDVFGPEQEHEDHDRGGE